MAIGFRGTGAVATAASAASITPAKPAGAVASDILVLCLSWRGTSSETINLPSGWTQVIRHANGNNASVLVAWARGDVASTAIGTPDLPTAILGFINGYSGVNQWTPLDVAAAGQTNASSTTCTAPSITTVTADAWLIGVHELSDSATFSGSFGTIRQQGNHTGGGFGISLVASTAPQATPGASGTKTITSDFAAQNIGVLFALRPASSVSTAVGTLGVPASDPLNTTYNITGLGFKPKLFLLWWTGATANGTVTASDMSRGFGAAVSTSIRRCTGSQSDNGANPSSTDSLFRNDCVAAFLSITGADNGRIDVDAVLDDGIRLIVDAVVGRAYTLSWMAVGGSDLTDVAIGDLTESPTASLTTNHTAGFKPDALIVAGSRATMANTPAAGGMFSFGMATGSATGKQFGMSSGQQDATAASAAWHFNRRGELLAGWSTTFADIDLHASLNAFTATGFDIFWTEVSTAQRLFFYVALKGGRYDLGMITTSNVDGSNQTVTAMTFAPHSFIVAGEGDVEDPADGGSGGDQPSIGFWASPTSRTVQGTYAKDAVTPSEVSVILDNDEVWVDMTGSAPISLDGAADIDQLNLDGFRWAQTLGAASHAAFWLAVGNAPASAPDGRVPLGVFDHDLVKKARFDVDVVRVGRFEEDFVIEATGAGTPVSNVQAVAHEAAAYLSFAQATSHEAGSPVGQSHATQHEATGPNAVSSAQTTAYDVAGYVAALQLTAWDAEAASILITILPPPRIARLLWAPSVVAALVTPRTRVVVAAPAATYMPIVVPRSTTVRVVSPGTLTD